MIFLKIILLKFAKQLLSMQANPWLCPPLNLRNWNLAWMWRVPAQESAPSTLWMYAVGATEQKTKFQNGYFYQAVKSNR